MSDAIQLDSIICGEKVSTAESLSVFNPYNNAEVGSVGLVDAETAVQMIERTSSFPSRLTRFQRSEILTTVRQKLLDEQELFIDLISRESGLCVRETRYEVSRAADVLYFASMEALKDDGQIFSCDVTPNGKPRKIFTTREPVSLALAITPFNHPLNQVAHKIAPAIAAGVPMMLKPSEKTPLTAIRFAELFFEAGLPGEMLSVFLAPIPEVIEPMISDERVELVTFTGGTSVGKRIAKTAGYKKLCLELGGNSPLLILRDADLDLAANLAAEGCFRNSGQRCTAVKRILVDASIKTGFVDRFLKKAETYRVGDPADPETIVGTVIDEEAAKVLESRIHSAVDEGATVLLGGNRQGAQLEPTVIDNVSRKSEMICKESFGPLAPILTFENLDDAITLANQSDFGLSSGVVTNDMQAALDCVKRIRTGTVNINQVPGYRIECSPFGGVKDSGLGIKEGVIEAMKYMTNVKTFSLPW